MSTADLLFELGTEELPPLALRRLSEALAAGVVRGLDELGVGHGEVHCYATPRRLAVVVEAVAARQPEQRVERRGPSVKVAFDAHGQPTKAALGFARSCGTTVEALERLSSDKGEWLLYRATVPGEETPNLLPGLLEQATRALPAPKRMRWGDLDESFVRPVHWIVALLGSAVLPFELFGIHAGRETFGHRFHAPGAIVLDDPTSYAQRLEEQGLVIADFAERRRRVREQVEAQAEKLGGRALAPEELVDEVTALVEWPVALAGRFDTRYLELPREVLIATLQGHQRYFPVVGQDGALMAAFVTVANLASRDPAQVRAGNERVVHPRLADALFFWDSDRKRPLESYTERLDHVAFQHRLGTLADKTGRLGSLCAWLCERLGQDANTVLRAAALSKADLLTDMVYEFTELQGVMGHYYALASDEPAEVAVALEEQYLPRFAGDGLPQTPAGQLLAVADRMDTMAGIFAIGQRPSGEKDPFGLRRAALGVLRIMIERSLDLDLKPLIAAALALQPVAPAGGAEIIEAQLLSFLFDRMQSHYTADGIAIEVFSAVAATGVTRPVEFDRRLKAVGHFLTLPQAGQLAAAHKRVRNILKQAGDRGKVDPSALHESAESALYEVLLRLEEMVAGRVRQQQYEQALSELAALQQPVDRFFDDVMVMSDDAAERDNRLGLLRRLDSLCRSVADLSCLPG